MSNDVAFNPNKFIKGYENENEHVIHGENTETTITNVTNTTNKKTRKSKKKEETEIVNKIPVPQTSMSYIQENIPYATAYQETNNQLDESIAQLNALGNEIVMELQSVRNSKTLRNKYNYINDMTTTATSIINAKISAIKEKNNTIKDINHLELTRLKELKTTLNQEDDNTRIANLYDAFINTPVGVGRAALAPPMQDIMMPNSDPTLNYLNIDNNSTEQNNWEQNLNPAQNRMLLEARGAIETVVVYDEITGNRWFDVVDKMTRQSVPNVEKPDSTYIYDLDINIHGGFAKDSNRNTIYPLIVIHGGDNSITEY